MSDADWSLEGVREELASSVADLATHLGRTRVGVNENGTGDVRLVWRGVKDIRYRLDSSLYRRVHARIGASTQERDLAAAEDDLITRARKQRYGAREGQELTDLEVLAVLQHYGAATRLVDVTRNVLIALWFATEQDARAPGRPGGPDGVLFGVDVSRCTLPSGRESLRIGVHRKGTGLIHWEPPPLEQRIRAQQSSFIFSRMPDPASSSRASAANTSLDLEPATLEEAGQEWTSRLQQKRPYLPRRRAKLIIFRIPAGAKRALRGELARFYGQDYESVYPDLPGFALSRRA